MMNLDKISGAPVFLLVDCLPLDNGSGVNMNYIEKVFKAAIYVRLSKEDGDSFLLGKNESDSITTRPLLLPLSLRRRMFPA